MRAPMTPKIIAAEIPALVISNIPVMAPIIPCFSASAIAPCTNELPKLVIGTVAPAPAKSISGSDRKSTRLNSSHVAISYAVFCLKKNKEPLTLTLKGYHNAALAAYRNNNELYAGCPPLKGDVQFIHF